MKTLIRRQCNIEILRIYALEMYIVEILRICTGCRNGVEKSLHLKGDGFQAKTAVAVMSPLFVDFFGHSYILSYFLSFYKHLFMFFLGGIATIHVKNSG